MVLTEHAGPGHGISVMQDMWAQLVQCGDIVELTVSGPEQP